MPQMDGTGPAGNGPGSGWGMGRCGRGMFPSFGCRRYHAPENELYALKEDELLLERELQAVRKEIESLEQKNK